MRGLQLKCASNAFVICLQCPRAKLSRKIEGISKGTNFVLVDILLTEAHWKHFQERVFLVFLQVDFKLFNEWYALDFLQFGAIFMLPTLWVFHSSFVCLSTLLPGWISFFSSCCKGSQPSQLPDQVFKNFYHISWKVWLQSKKSEEIVFSRTVGMTWKKNSDIWPSQRWSSIKW